MANSQRLTYTIGHSNRGIDEFVELLGSVGVRTLVDVRAYPTSRRHPQFDSNRLRSALADADISYHWAGRNLGGFRQDRPDSRHLSLTSSLRAYADHMETPKFQRAADQLVRLTNEACTTIMCAEKQPAHCHRSLIADYLSFRGTQIRHLVDIDETLDHRLSRLVRCEGEHLIYDCLRQGELELNG
jgi:uncharacterized protein (DUF488 family)